MIVYCDPKVSELVIFKKRIGSYILIPFKAKGIGWLTPWNKQHIAILNV